MIAYKLVRQMKSGKLSPLFINKKLRFSFNEWLIAETHPTKGYAVRHGWHCCSTSTAPHLSQKNRVWVKVEIDDYTELKRPESQGGIWYLANKMKILKIIVDNEI